MMILNDTRMAYTGVGYGDLYNYISLYLWVLHTSITMSLKMSIYHYSLIFSSVFHLQHPQS
jgi:hypothetical protein